MFSLSVTSSPFASVITRVSAVASTGCFVAFTDVAEDDAVFSSYPLGIPVTSTDAL